MKNTLKVMLCSGLALAAGLIPQILLPQQTEARTYQSDSDTDAEILDYIENRRRTERENMQTPEQKQLLADAYKMRQELRNPLDPTKNVPVAIEGDEMFYNQETGDVEVNGNVQLTTLDARRFNSDKLTGNVDESTIEVEGEAKMLQLTPGQARIILTGYKTQYDYTRQLGKMEDAKGKMNNQYIRSKRIEFYPDVMVIYNGSATKCSAEHPDYRMTADRIEIYPDGRSVSYNVKYYLKDIVVYSSSKEINDPNSDNMPHLPRVGYDSDDGFWIKDTYTWHPLDRVRADLNLAYLTKPGWRSNGEITWSTRGLGKFSLYQGYYDDSDSRWIRKGPTVEYDYGHRLFHTPFHWNFQYIRGNWHQKRNGKYVDSLHTYYKWWIGLDPIKLGAWQLRPAADYSITKEELNSTKVKGMSYSMTLFREFDKKWAFYSKYAYSQVNNRETAFDFDNDAYSRKLSAGLSYQMTNNDRFVAGYRWDMDNKRLDNIDYYWFHQLHCAEVILHFRSKLHNTSDTKDKKYSVKFQFTPW